jgi:cytochrome c
MKSISRSLPVLTLLSVAWLPQSLLADQALATSSGCMACHAIDKKVVGPSLKDIAAKYKGDASAASSLVAKVKDGGSGVWGAVPMPPSTVSEADITTIVNWMLTQ